MANGLLDFLQGASNAAAANVSAPVDGLTWLLNKLGADIKTPVGGSDWMRERGLTAEPTNKLAGILGESVGGVLPMVTAAKAPQIAQGLLQAERNLAAPRTLNPQTGAILWHGSPHKFDAFDSSKIGTGEGAQAYGHGLYLAESDKVAGEYANMFAKSPASPAQLLKLRDAAPKGGAEWSHYDDLVKNGQGSLYKVDLPDEHIAKMLDWDKPLSEQPHIIDALKNTDILKNTAKEGGWYGDWLKEAKGAALVRKADVNEAEALRQAGIPGIRYLDGGSRGTGAGTSNYVVFPGNEGLLSILERNGQPIK